MNPAPAATRSNSDRRTESLAEPAPRAAVQRRLWLKIHLYLGLFAGAVFVVAGLTGSLIAFGGDIDAWLNADLMRIPAPADGRGAQRPIDQLIGAARTVIPTGGQAVYLTFPRDTDRALSVEYALPSASMPDEDDRFEVFVNPYTARVTGQRVLERADALFSGPIIQILVQLHYNLLLGTTGTALVGIVAIFLMISVITGLVVWWPRNGKWAQALTIKRKAGAERRNFDLHKTFGFYSAGIFLVILFTGVYMNLPDYVTPLIELFSPAPGWPEDVNSAEPESEQLPLTAGQVLAISERVFADGELMGLALPQSPEEPYVIRRRAPDEVTETYPHRQIWVDQYSGEVLAVNDPHAYSAGQKFVEWQYPLHCGEAFGLAGRILVLLSGLVPALLYVTGIIRWLQKRRAAARKKDRRVLVSSP